MPDHRLRDYETPTPEAAAGFERYHAAPDWDARLAVDDARRELDERDPWAGYFARMGDAA